MKTSSTYNSIKLVALSPSGESLGTVFARETWAGFMISGDSELRILSMCDTPRFCVSSGWASIRDFSGAFVYGPGPLVRRYPVEVSA